MPKSTPSKNVAQQPEQEEAPEVDESSLKASVFSPFGQQTLLKALEVVAFAGLYSTVSQLTLSPVYGSVPAGLYHQRAAMFIFLFTFLAKGILRRIFPRSIATWIPIIAFWIPRYQYILFNQSFELGPTYGPLVTEALTFYPVALLSTYVAGELLDLLDLSIFEERVAELAPAIASYIVFNTAQKLSKSMLPKMMGTSVVMTRVGLQVVIATLYATILPSKMLVLSVPPLLFSATQNVHGPLNQTTGLVNATLAPSNYIMLDRQESLTGYISVLENTKEEFRVMRCDHSLLGGEWTTAQSSKIARVKEPIYAVFAMLEAVRLVQTGEVTSSRRDADSSALVIGLGIGTTPTALISHGIDTTIVEIDPIVHDYAVKYFNLPRNHTAFIEDVTPFIQRVTAAVPPIYTYDYIIHDVFTGGAEPIELFTFEFLRDMRKLLKPDGVIAINYAGDLALPTAGLVVSTIQSVFPSCRIFREDVRAEGVPTDDYTNMVVFCKKSPGPLLFRKPVEADFLGSGARKAYLLPQHEVEAESLTKGKKEVIKKGETHKLAQWQAKSAVGHWEVMRTVIPSRVWQNW